MTPTAAPAEKKPLWLFFDRDFTLAPTQDQRISEEVCQYLCKLEKLGHKIFISSGKPVGVVLSTALETGLERPGVSGENGAVTLNDGFDDRGLFPPANEMVIVDDKTGKALLKLRQEMKERFGDKTVYPNRWFQPNEFNPSCSYIRGNGTIPKMEKEVEKLENSLKVATALSHDQSAIQKLNKDIALLKTDIANATKLRDDLIAFFQEKKKMPEYSGFEIYVHPDGVEMISPTVTKGTAIEKICEKHGISKEQTISFGDGSNDVPMFLTTGYSYGVNLKPQNIDKASENHPSIMDALKAFTKKFLPQHYDHLFEEKIIDINSRPEFTIFAHYNQGKDSTVVSSKPVKGSHTERTMTILNVNPSGGSVKGGNGKGGM